MRYILLAISLSLLILSCSEETVPPKRPLSFYTLTFRDFPSDGGEARPYIRGIFASRGIDLDYRITKKQEEGYTAYLTQQLNSGKAAMAFPVDYMDLEGLSESGYLLPLDDVITRMPHYREVLDETLLAKYRINGVLYALPHMYNKEGNNGSNLKGCAIRSDWLTALDLDIPETLEELEKVLHAFTYGDPDGNGRDDTVGMSLDSDLSMMFWGAFGLPYFCGEDAWVEKEGEFFHVTALEETGELLSLLARWYEAGYINLDAMNDSARTIYARGQTGIVSLTAWNLNEIRKEWKNKGLTARGEMMPPVSGPRGSQGYPLRPGDDEALALSTDMTEEELKLMIDFLDWMVSYDEDGGIVIVNNGREGIDYRVTEEGGLAAITPYADLVKKGYGEPLNPVTIIYRSWMDEVMLADHNTINARENLFLSPDYHRVPLTDELYLQLHYYWPEVVLEVITGVKAMNAWEFYAAAPVLGYES